MKKIAVFLLILACAGGGAYYWKFHLGGVSSQEARIEARMTPIGPPFSGMVAEVLVGEGDVIAEGEVLFRLDSGSLLAALAQEKENLAALEETLPPSALNPEKAAKDSKDASRLLPIARQAEQDARIEMEAMSDAKAQTAFALAALRARSEKAGKNHPDADDLQKALAANDNANGNFLRAKDRFESASLARAALEREVAAKPSHDSLTQGRLLLHAAQQEKIRHLEYALDTTMVRSPQAGRVIRMNIEVNKAAVPGENAVFFIPFTPENLWITARFSANKAEELRLGRECLIKFPGFTGPAVNGRIDAVFPQERGDKGNIIPVRIVLNEYDESIMNRVQPGLATVVTLDGKLSPLAALWTQQPKAIAAEPAKP
ncbi:efflux RND transporter periplasmic adaptor subunit [Desulfovibrio sp. OttesenSCG-928-I05]|nr:efflux RND transporter periplasmic adaptor subunit [Desulfovibrio sp. OttesenSCG-928-I05]